MKKTITHLLPFVAGLIFLTSVQATAQTNSPSTSAPASQERLLQDLVNEVHQLRVVLQRMNATSYRAQITMERLRLEQEQVVRLTRELSTLRDEIGAIRSRQVSFKQLSEDMAKQVQAGVTSDKDLKGLLLEFEASSAREQHLVERESKVVLDLDLGRAVVTELNSRLDALEKEIGTPTTDDTRQPVRKQIR